MEKKIFFEIPDDQEIMAKLIEAVPSHWSWVDGVIIAPETILTSGAAVRETGFDISRYHDIKPTIVGSYDGKNSRRLDPDLVAILVERRLPGFINFDEAGYRPSLVTLELSKRIATSFIRQGYQGSLSFFKDHQGESKYKNSAVCGMALFSKNWKERMVDAKDIQPPYIKLGWDKNFGGKPEDIEPIVISCRALGLREYEPEIVT